MAAWTKSVPSETEKTGSKDVCEVELTGLDDRLYMTDERERERSKDGSQVLGLRCY